MKKIYSCLAILAIIFISSCSSGTSEVNKFIRVSDMKFTRNGKPYTYMGTNFWYGLNLGSKAKEGTGQG